MGKPRIEYNSLVVDFQQYLNDYHASPEAIRATNEAASGVAEHLYFYERWFVDALVERLNAGTVDELEKWYEYVRDGSSFKFWHDYDFGLYIPFLSRSANTHEGLAPTYERTGLPHVLNDHSGLVEQVAVDTVQIPAGKYDDGVAIFGAMTNSMTDSEDFTDIGSYNTSDITAASESNVTDPAGGTAADSLTAAAADAYIEQHVTISIGATDDVCFSVWLCAAVYRASNVTLKILNASRDELASETVTVTTEWERFSVYWDNPGTTTGLLIVQIVVETSGDVIYAWGGQCEKGTNRLYPTPYAQTGGSAVNVGASKFYYAVTGDTHIGRFQGTICFWFYPLWANYEGGGAGLCSTRYLLYIVDSNGDPAIEIYRGTSGQLVCKFTGIDGSTASTEVWAGDLTQNAWNFIALRYDMVNGFIKPYIGGGTLPTAALIVDEDGTEITDEDGVNLVSEDFGMSLPSTYWDVSGVLTRMPATMYVGHSISATIAVNHADGYFDELFITKEILTEQRLATLANSAYAQGLRRNYFSALELVDPHFKPLLKRGGNKYEFKLIAREVLT